jgi:PrtD family type I secretion system ABC transporter
MVDRSLRQASQEGDLLRQAIRASRSAFVAVAIFSCAINILMLTGPVFMLQVYDRVLTSRSIPTLVALCILVLALFLFMALFDFIRVRVLSRMGYRLDQQLAPLTFRNWVAQGLAGRREMGRPLSDLSTLRSFLGSPALIGLFDLPWVPIYLAVVFILHMQLGLLALGGAAIVVALAIANELLTRKPLERSMAMEASESRLAEQSLRNADTIVAMGMMGNVGRHWIDARNLGANFAQTGGERAEIFAAISKSIRMILQSAILALGALLAIEQQISAGMIVAASIIAGRALAPVDQVVGQWRQILKARLSWKRLKEHLRDSTTGKPLRLPAPEGRLAVRNLVKYAPSTDGDRNDGRRVILGRIDFDLAPGDGLGVIGPSASGKTSLARVLIGAWSPDSGVVRLDGASLDQWDRDELGKHIGYLPQTVDLLAGTIGQNISRFDPEASDEAIIAAAQLAGVHEMILRLPEGYGSRVDFGVKPLSGGQIQRIALARAVYRTPRLVVLDEPNSNLDAEGDTALSKAIEQLREAGSVVIVMAHRPSAIVAVNKLLMLHDGGQAEFGDKTEIMRKMTRVAAG